MDERSTCLDVDRDADIVYIYIIHISFSETFRERTAICTLRLTAFRRIQPSANLLKSVVEHLSERTT